MFNLFITNKLYSDHQEYTLHFLRILAIILVVLCHATEEIYKWDIGFINNLSIQSRIFGFSAFTLGRLSVPIFMFITGYFLLCREYPDGEAVKKFWLKHLVPLLVTTEIWIVMYNIILKVFFQQPFKWNVLVKNILFFEQVKMGHMWYMSMILGMYLFLPFVSRALQQLSKNIILLPYCLAVVYLTVVPVVNDILHATGKSGIWCMPVLDFSGGYYGLIIIAGYLYRRFWNNKEFSYWVLLLLGSGSFCLVVALQLFYFSHGLRYAVWYHWFPLLACSACLALLVIKVVGSYRTEYYSVVAALAQGAFGVYLVHFPLLMALNKFLSWPGSMPVRVMSLFIVATVLSYGIVLLLGRIPAIAKVLFYQK